MCWHCEWRKMKYSHSFITYKARAHVQFTLSWLDHSPLMLGPNKKKTERLDAHDFRFMHLNFNFNNLKNVCGLDNSNLIGRMDISIHSIRFFYFLMLFSFTHFFLSRKIYCSKFLCVFGIEFC